MHTGSKILTPLLLDSSLSHWQVYRILILLCECLNPESFIPFIATGALLPENLCIREDAGTLVIPVERYGNLVIQSRFDVATRPSTPAEAVGESFIS